MLREIIKLRSDARFKAAISAAARDRGVTVSTLIRDQLRPVLADQTRQTGREARA